MKEYSSFFKMYQALFLDKPACSMKAFSLSRLLIIGVNSCSFYLAIGRKEQPKEAKGGTFDLGFEDFPSLSSSSSSSKSSSSSSGSSFDGSSSS